MKSFIILSALLITMLSTFAQTPFKAKQINVFKNGIYFIEKEGEIAVSNKKAVIPFTSQPLLGTFWVASGGENDIKSVTFKTDTLKKAGKASSITEILEANTGKKIKIGYKLDNSTFREVAGVLNEYVKSSGLIRIKASDGKTIFLYAAEIKELSIEETPVLQILTDTIMSVAVVEFARNISAPSLRVIYMQQGIQWIPMYNLRILNDKELMIEMKAVVENFSENIEKANLTLTVGNPQFFFGKTLDPVGSRYLSDFSTAYTSDLRAANLPFAQSYMLSNSYIAEDQSGYFAYDAEMQTEYSTEGEKSGDLYMYNIGEVSLPKNTKASFNVFSAKIPYKDVYEVSVSDESNYYYNRYVKNDPEKRYDVFHSFKLSNNTVNPFTTAPGFVLNEKNQPVAQDRIKYTPVGGTVSVQLSKAGDVVVKNTEEETNITENAKKIGKTIYRLVSIKGIIEIENLQKKNIQLNVKKLINAKITKLSNEGKISKTGKYYDINPHSEAAWEIMLKGEEKKSITYEYEVYIRSN